MYKPLSDIDSVYKRTISKLPCEQRQSYCEFLIEISQYNLVRNKKRINGMLEEQLYQVILAAQKEISKIEAEDFALMQGPLPVEKEK